MKGKKIITVLIIINLILIGIIYNLVNQVNVNNKKQIIKEMTEDAQVPGLQTQINTLNKSHEEYVKNVQSYKSQIASTITDMGVETEENADITTISSNIRSLEGVLGSNKPTFINKNYSTSSSVSLSSIIPTGYKYAIIIMEASNSYNTTRTITCSTNEVSVEISSANAVISNAFNNHLNVHLITFDSSEVEHTIQSNITNNLASSHYGSHIQVFAL